MLRAAVPTIPRPLTFLIPLILALTVCPARGHVGLDELQQQADDEVARRPDDPQTHLAASRMHEERGEWDAALEALEAAAERGADTDVVSMIRSRVFLEAGWPRMAKRELDLLLRRRPDAYAAFLERGRAWAKLGNLDRAAADLGEAIAHLPRPTPEQVIERRDLLVAAGRTEDAVRALDDGMARVGRVASLQLAAVDLEVGLRRFDAALGRLDELLVRNPGNPLWVARRGDILTQAGRPDDARAAYAAALRLIEARPAGRGGGQLGDLKRRLDASVGASVVRDQGERR
jgi:predicted Zn-dependent protease